MHPTVPVTVVAVVVVLYPLLLRTVLRLRAPSCWVDSVIDGRMNEDSYTPNLTSGQAGRHCRWQQVCCKLAVVGGISVVCCSVQVIANIIQ
jgi:hypothetical protein